MNIIETNNLTKYYGKTKGIEDVNITVKEGEIYGFIGPNGAGKSTTIRTLLGLIFPTSGYAKIFGKDCIEKGHEVRRSIGYLPSETFYYERMKVWDLLNYSASFFKGDYTNRINELSEVMELDINRKIEDLSYGNKKKVGIVQGLLHKPKLIMLDEPTGGLDPLMQKQFFNLIRKENQEGATIFFSSHILSEVQHLCHRVAIIKDGSIIQVEDIATLQKNNYKKIMVKGENLSIKPFDFKGVTNLTLENQTLKFFFKGDINQVKEKLQPYKIKDLLIEDPTLEEIFMHYYE
ncbi:ABC transporter ATP-binding protein [Isachenkonia alkalipeptolytica]|uniref:ABC transporter ATP-binding protein n=1 Tax=Isachenkonia alkalipeptolytica TaxID=2565777 RepID=A0AA43XL98_9CLOT|nr:ABC transporter ATP-binding protein [Isachenkonia alkalipeptolytica]NBG88471.1 ABC transporter ATP-binding protein [Isachenkonia alkalipeptolytica]